MTGEFGEVACVRALAVLLTRRTCPALYVHASLWNFTRKACVK